MATQEQINFRKQWVDALRSGNYEQTKEVLYDGIGYCCFGVACVLAGVPIVRHSFDEEVALPNRDYFFEIGGESYRYCLPLFVQKKLGLRNMAGYFFDEKENKKVSLTELNDNKGYTFAQIADVIESAPKGLFME